MNPSTATMAAEQGPSLVVQPEYHIDLEIPPAPSEIPGEYYYVHKLPLLAELASTYAHTQQNKKSPTVYGAFQQASFVLLGSDAVNTLRNDPDKLQAVGEGVQPLISFCTYHFLFSASFVVSFTNCMC